MKIALTGDRTGTTTHVMFRETDITTGEILKKTDVTLKKTEVKIALTIVMNVVIGMVIDATR